MAKNTNSSAFRKIDVDQYNEDNFKDDEQENQQLSGIDEGEINQLLLKQNNVEVSGKLFRFSSSRNDN